MSDRYMVGWHSSEIHHPHVTLVNGSSRDDIFDVALPHIEDDETDPDYLAARAALDLMVARANGIIDAIARVQRLRDAAVIERDRHDSVGEGLTSDGSWKDWEAEAYGDGNDREVETFDRVLDVLQILAHGDTPMQGAAQVALASDFVADADGRDARFTRTDDGHEPVADEAPEVDERPNATIELMPWELDALATICHNSQTKSDAGLWMRDRVLDKQVRNRLGKA